MQASTEEAAKMTDVEKLAALCFSLARSVIWLEASGGIKTKFDPGEDGFDHVGAALVREARAVMAMAPDEFLGGEKGIHVPEGTAPDEADFIRKYPFHIAAILMQYPEKLPRIVVPEDPFEVV